MRTGIFLVIGCLVAVVAYRESVNFKKKNGVTPWHWPSWVWAGVGFLSLLLAAVLLLIAERTTKPLQPAAFQSAVPGSPAVSTFPQPTAAALPTPPAASWQHDPTGRYAARYWDGGRWTDFVSDGTATTTDPLPA